MSNAQAIYKKLDVMNLSQQARDVINTTDQYAIEMFDGLDEVDVEMLCEDIAKEV